MRDASGLTGSLLAWYGERARDLPWRRSRDPYFIWVSEIMLQQTQVATVIPYFERWVARFPAVEALAAAPEDDVLKHWEGLGYYSRARHLQAAAKMVVEHHAGQVPDTWDAVRRLPGVGDYTAGAVLSIAFGQRVAAVDGNVLRVMSRLALVHEDVTKPATKKAMGAMVGDLLAHTTDSGSFNQALMELGATVCVPARPRCDVCPVSAYCRAFAAGVAEELPVKSGVKRPKDLVLASALVQRPDGRILLMKRPAPGIWGGLWALPSVEIPAIPPEHAASAGPVMAQALALEGLTGTAGALVTQVSHTLTHRALTIPVFELTGVEGSLRGVESAWVGPEELRAYALPVPFQKVLRGLDPGPLFRSL